MSRNDKILEIIEKQKKWNITIEYPSELEIEAFDIAFPIVRNVGTESKQRIQKRMRMLKFKKILEKDVFDSITSQEEYDELVEHKPIYRLLSQDLVSVSPMGAPSGQLMYMDFVYDSKKEKQLLRKKKLKKILDKK